MQTPSGWTSVNTSLGTRTGVVSLSPTDGTHQLWLNNGNTIYQNTGEVITEGTTYTLTVDFGPDQNNFPNIETLLIRLYGSDAGFGTALSEITPSGPATTQWMTDQTVMFTATAGQATGQTLGIALGVTSGTQSEWDNVRLTASAPPPANTFLTWIDGFGLDPADEDLTDDPDGDRLANAIEAWFGTHPGQFNGGLSEFSTDGTTTTFEHPQNDDPPSDLSGHYEWSLNLVDWYPSGSGPVSGPTVSFVPNTDGTTTTVTATASEALESLFLRVGVMQD